MRIVMSAIPEKHYIDRRAECLAIERRDPSGCTSIRNPDDREVCRQRAGQRDLFGRERR
jgi:hypothetical protein